MPLINRETNLILTWFDRCFTIDNLVDNQKPAFTITNAKLCVPIVTWLTQDNTNLLEQLKSCFKRTTNWNKYEPKVTVELQNQYLDFLINPSFQGVNKLFVSSFEDNDRRRCCKKYYLPLAEIKDYNIVTDGQNVFDQPVKNNLRTYSNILKIATGQGDHYTTGCLIDYK